LPKGASLGYPYDLIGPHQRSSATSSPILSERRRPAKVPSAKDALTSRSRASILPKLAPSDVSSVPGDDRLNGSRLTKYSSYGGTSKPRRVIVCGGRDYNDKKHVAETLYELLEVRARDDTIIVHGASRGADLLAAKCAETWGLGVEPHPALWDKHGSPAAAHIRNQAMVDAGAQLCIAFPGGQGTADCVRRARKAGIPVREEKPPEIGPLELCDECNHPLSEHVASGWGPKSVCTATVDPPHPWCGCCPCVRTDDPLGSP
jgi:YspA, cpYpsA-related SLOG family